MRTKIKFPAFLLVAILSVASFLPVTAQQFSVNTVQITGTATTNLNGGNGSTCAIPNAAATTYTFGTTNALITLSKYDGCSIQVSSALMGAGTGAVLAMFDASNDGTNWVSPYTYVTYASTGTTRNGSGTNLVNQHWQFLRLKYVTNATDVVLTNLNVSYTLKPKRNG